MQADSTSWRTTSITCKHCHSTFTGFAQRRVCDDCRTEPAKWKRRSAERRAIVETAKKVPCGDCGQRFPSYVMDFDHRDPSQKVVAVSVMAFNSGHTLQALRDEIAKCDVVCANCHRVRTFGSRS